MFTYEPKLYELIFYPILGGLIALGIVRAYPSPEAWVFLWAVEINCAIVPAIYLFKEGARYLDNATPSQPQYEERPIKASDDLPQVRYGDEPIYNQNTLRLKIDCIARFNKILIAQRNGNLKVDMSEGFWLKTKEGLTETEWKRIGGQGPTEFRTMLSRGEKFGAYKKEGGQGKRTPADWQKIRRLANGDPLPN